MSETNPHERVLGRAALHDLACRGFTRRQMLRVAALVGASAVLPFGSEHALAQLSNTGAVPDDAVKINANEFPEGPSPAALEALLAVARRGNRYQYPETDALVATAAAQRGPDGRALRGLPGLEPGAAPRRDRLHLAEGGARHRRPRLRGGGAGREVHRRRGGARAAAPGRRARSARDARRREEPPGRPVLRLQSEQPDRHRHPARRHRVADRRQARAARSCCSTRRTSTSATSRRAPTWCARTRTSSCCARSRRSTAWPACARASRSRRRTCSRA